MQIIIDIPEEKYNMIKNKMYCGIYDAEIYKAIASGVPRETVTEFADRCKECGKMRTGHWEWLTEDKYRCSNCNHETRVDECMNKPMYDFCPFCDARMESEV